MGSASAGAPAPGTRPRVRILGTTSLGVGGVDLALSSSARRVLARMAIARGAPVTVSQLIDAVWLADPPATARAAVQNQISRIRAGAGVPVIRRADGGYILDADVDLADVEAAVAEAERVIAVDPVSALALLEAVDSTVSEPLADLAGHRTFEAWRAEAVVTLEGAADLAVEAALAAGLRTRALASAIRLAASSPYNEHRAALLARALHAAGRRGDALSAIARIRRNLRADLGMEMGAELRAVQSSVLSGGGAAAPLPDTDFVGRDRELAQLRRSLRSSARILVTGEPGIGISRLLTEVRARMSALPGHRVAFARVTPNPDTALGPLVDLMNELGVAVDGTLGILGGFVPGIARLAAAGTVVLIVDDLHYAGPSTRAALIEAAETAGAALLAGGYDVTPAGFDSVLPLSGLDADTSAALVSSRAVVPLAADVLQRVVGLAGGNPLYLETLLADTDLLGGSEPSGFPDALAALARKRVRSLPDNTRRTVFAAAVAGSGHVEALFLTLGLSEGLDDAIARQILDRSPQGVVTFRHGALERILHDDQSIGHRQELHHETARALERLGAPPATIARHRLASAEIDRDAARSAARAAAAAATAIGAHRDAVTWLTAALRVAIPDERERENLDLLIALGDAQRLAGDAGHVEVLTAAAERAEAAGLPDLLGSAVFALLQLGGSSVATTVSPRTERLVRRTLRLLPDSRLRATVSAAASLAYSMTGNAARSRDYFLTAERASRGDEEARRSVIPLAYLGIGLPGDADARDGLARELIAYAEADDDPVGLFEGHHLEASVSLQRGEGARLRDGTQRMSGLLDRVGDVGRRWALQYLTAAVAHLDGKLDDAERLSGEGYGLFAGVSESRAAAAHYGQVFILRVHQGRLDELSPLLTAMVEAQPGVPAWHAARALALVESDPVGALDEAEATLGAVQADFTWLAAHVIGGRAVALVAANAGLTARSSELLGRFRSELLPWSGIGCWQGTCSYGPVDTSLALIARAGGADAEATALAERARGFAARLDAPVFAADLDALGFPDRNADG